MRNYHRKLWVLVICLVGLLLFSITSYAKDYDLTISYTREKIADISNVQFINVGIIQDVDEDYFATGEIGFTSPGQMNHDSFVFKANIYRQLFHSNHYFIGLGYKYFYDQKANYLDLAGKLNKHLISVNLLGSRKIYQFTCTSELSYAPFGGYNFINQDTSSLSALTLEIKVSYPIDETLDAFVSVTGGREHYQGVTKTYNSNSVGFRCIF